MRPAAERAARAQSVADLGAPLVVHACTSITNPTSLRDWWVIGYEYWSAKPSPVRLCPSGYPNPDRRRACILMHAVALCCRLPRRD
jgi:hypothetical protein